MPILALKSVKKWKEKTKTDGEETEKDVAYTIAKPPEPKHKMVLMRDKVLFFLFLPFQILFVLTNFVCLDESIEASEVFW